MNVDASRRALHARLWLLVAALAVAAVVTAAVAYETVRGAGTAPQPASTLVPAGAVGLLPASCATVDPAGHPCPDMVEVAR